MSREEQSFVVEDWMTKEPITIQYDHRIGDALRLMYELDIRHLPVLEDGKLVGIVSDRDIRQLFGRAGGTSRNRAEEERYLRLPVGEVMSARPVTVKADVPVGEAIKRMIEHKFGALPVVDLDGRVLGIFTELDALRYCLYLTERYQGVRE
jgi:acetoin utilization protein AcuB